MSRSRWATVIVVATVTVYLTVALVGGTIALLAGGSVESAGAVTSAEYLLALAALAVATVVLWGITQRIWRGGRQPTMPPQPSGSQPTMPPQPSGSQPTMPPQPEPWPPPAAADQVAPPRRRALDGLTLAAIGIVVTAQVVLLWQWVESGRSAASDCVEVTVRLVLLGPMMAALGSLACSSLFAARSAHWSAYVLLVGSLALVTGGVTAVGTGLGEVCGQGESLGQGLLGFAVVAGLTAVAAIWPGLVIGFLAGRSLRWLRER